ncbi:hypothetical protein [Nannocystis pusilla]|uniref:hypothetical protein n=1 Tax=Nannocystis pusilla TaxID=889268 RepID=UPI003B78ACCA
MQDGVGAFVLVRRAGAELVVVDGPPPGDSPEAVLMRQLVDAVAEFEAGVIRERSCGMSKRTGGRRLVGHELSGSLSTSKRALFARRGVRLGVPLVVCPTRSPSRRARRAQVHGTCRPRALWSCSRSSIVVHELTLLRGPPSVLVLDTSTKFPFEPQRAPFEPPQARSAPGIPHV